MYLSQPKNTQKNLDTVPTGELDSVELVPNIILNPGFCDSDEQQHQQTQEHREASPIMSTTYHCNGTSGGVNSMATGGGLTIRHHHPNHLHLPQQYDPDDILDEDDETPTLTFSRKMSIFFTGNTIKRI